MFLIVWEIYGSKVIYRMSQKKATASDFKIKTFISHHSKKEVLIFLFDVLFRPFCETHCVKGSDKNVSLFLIVRRKMVYLGVPKKM